MHRYSDVDDSESIHKRPNFDYLNKVIQTVLKCRTKKHGACHLRDTMGSASGSEMLRRGKQRWLTTATHLAVRADQLLLIEKQTCGNTSASTMSAAEANWTRATLL